MVGWMPPWSKACDDSIPAPSRALDKTFSMPVEAGAASNTHAPTRSRRACVCPYVAFNNGIDLKGFDTIVAGFKSVSLRYGRARGVDGVGSRRRTSVVREGRLCESVDESKGAGGAGAGFGLSDLLIE